MQLSPSSYRSVCDRINGVRRASGEAVAVEFGDTLLSYAELDARAGVFAGYLSGLGVGPGSTVAICMERSVEWIVASLGILQVGAAYVPINPAWPESRIRYSFEDSGASIIVAPAKLLHRLGQSVPGIDPYRDAIAIATAAKLAAITIQPESIAYVIYTSGSSGVPKGVEITHGNLSHLIEWHLDAFHVTGRDRASHLAGLGFDAAVWEIWPTLSAGATLLLAEEAVRLSPELMQEWFLRERVTIGFVPTVHAAALIAMDWPVTTSLRILLTGGDALPHAPAFPLPFAVVNNYGPTECTVVATSCLVTAGSSGAPPIGLPIAGARVYLLDSDGQQVADGVIGELFVGGNGVGRGYRNLPDATRFSFLPDTLSSEPGARMYRTGDRGVRRANGEIEFHGRSDRQVKIRGQRIELDEISSVLNQHPTVQFAVAAVNGSEVGRPELVAYILPKHEGTIPTSTELQEFLGSSLPSYMVPGTFLRLSDIPLSHNGKLDLTRLPSAAVAPLPRREAEKTLSTEVESRLLLLVQELIQNKAVQSKDNFFLAGGHSLLGMQLIMRVRSTFGVDLTLHQLFDAPTVEHLAETIEMRLTEERLTEIWKELLGPEQIGPDADFFELGGNGSLMDLQLRIAVKFGRQITTDQLLEHPTLRGQAELVSGRVREISSLPHGVVAVQSHGEHQSIFWLHYPCPNLARAMGEERPFLCLTLTDEDLRKLGHSPSLQEIAACLVPRIVAAQTTGPYILGGFCLGGILSYEVASQLQRLGHEVSLLLLLDTPSPEYYRPAELQTLITRPAYLTRRLLQLGLRTSLANLFERASSRFPNRMEPVPPQGERVQQMIENAAFRYKPLGYEGKVAMIMATDLPPNSPPHEDFLPWWQSLVTHDLEIQYVKGVHLDLVEGAAVDQVAKVISSHLLSVEQVTA